MAFKQQCPSCEAMVPVKDEGLIGKKIECPKCKYRFVVLEPDEDIQDAADEPKPKKKAKAGGDAKAAGAAVKAKPSRRRDDDDDSGAPRGGDDGDDDAPKPKKKAASNTTLYVGVGIGAVALVALAVGGALMLQGDSGSSSAPSPSPSASVTPPAAARPADVPKGAESAASGPPAAAGNVGGNTGEKKDPPLPTGPLANVSNLIPNDVHRVTAFDLEKFAGSVFDNVMFGPSGFRKPEFKAQLGVAYEDLFRLINTRNFKTNGSFNVLQSKKALPVADMKAALRVTSPKGAIRNRQYFLAPANELLDAMSMMAKLVEAEDGPREKDGKDDKPKAPKRWEPVAVCFYDANTVMLADEETMRQFLNVVGTPEFFKTRVQQPAAPGTTPPSQQSAPPPGVKGLRAGIASSGGAAPGQAPPPGEGTPGTPGAAFTSEDSYRTLANFSLKAVLERLEEGGDLGIVTQVHDVANDEIWVKAEAQSRRQTGGKGPKLSDVMTATGFSVKTATLEKADLIVAVEMANATYARTLETALKAVMPNLARNLSLVLGHPVETPGVQGGGGSAVGFAPSAASGGPGGSSAGLQEEGGSRAPGQPGQPQNENSNIKSKLTLTLSDKVLVLAGDIFWPEKIRNAVTDELTVEVTSIKGAADMIASRPRWHEFGSTITEVRRKQGSFPRGTYDRPVPETRGGRPYPASDRVSWMATMLPFVGQDDVFRRLQQDRSWRDEANLAPAAAWVPPFLNPFYPRETWTAKPPSLRGKDLGATHFVGVGGVGRNAAAYPDDAKHAKKLGVFGYDRQIRFQDVADKGDGLSNTIAVLQVPPTVQRPWIAGGGATIVGVAEKDSFAEFSMAQPGGVKKGEDGTFALMADGSVRFIKKGITDKLFQAMCTYKGEELDVSTEIDQFSEKVPPPGSPTLRAEPKRK